MFKNKIFSRFTSLHGLLDGLTRNNSGSFDSDTLAGFFVQGTHAVNGVSQSVNDTAQKFGTNGNIDNGTGTLDNISFFDEFVIT